MTNRIKPEELCGTRQDREFRMDCRAIDEESRTVDIAFSSEAPVERWWGTEILSHEPGAVRLGRMSDGAPLLLQHDPDKQIGVIESARIDGDKRGRSSVRFSRSALGEDIFQDVRDGIRRKVSVGYIIHEVKLQESGDDGDVYLATDWEPIENSIVSLAADNDVGVNRSANFNHTRDNPMPDPAPIENPVETPESINPEQNREIPAEPAAQPQPPANPETPEHAEMRSIGAHFGMRDLAEDHIKLGSTLKEFRALVRAAAADRIQAVPVAPRIESHIPRRTKNLRAFRPELYGSMPAADEAAYRTGQWAKATIFGDEEALRWCKDASVRVMTGTSAATSAVVPDEMVLPLIDLREQYGIARQRCFVHPMTSDTATVPRRASGVTAYFAGRDEATTESDATFDDIMLVARELSALTRLANAYVQDSAINLADFLTREMAYAFAVKEDQCLFDGDGTSTYGGIYGIRPKIIDGTHTAGAIDAASGHDTWLEITVNDLSGVEGALPEFPGIMGSWYVSKRADALMFGRLKMAGGGNTKRDLSAGDPKQWNGDDIVITQAMPKGTGVTDYSNVAMAIYGDLNMGVTMGDRQTFEIQILRELYAAKRQTGVIGVERFDLVAHGLGDTSDAGPIVALIGE